MGYGSIVGGWALKFDHVRRGFCHDVLALQEADFYVGTVAFPLDFIVARLAALFR